MPSRSHETTVMFANAFSVGETTGTKPAGEYRVVIDEDEILGVSFLAYQRVATRLYTPAIGMSGHQQVFEVDRADLAAALEVDRQAHEAI